VTSTQDAADRPILSVEGLSTYFRSDGSALKAVDEMSFSINRGETVALVGESGSGKSITALSIMQLLPPAGRIVRGSIEFCPSPTDVHQIVGISEREMRHLRGNKVGMIFQEPMTSLNPVFTVGEQIMEPLRIHLRLSQKAARKRAIEILEQVGIAEPHRRVDEYPHRLSGGMRQRVMIGIALSCEPTLLIADEPTTALDVTIQAQILHLLQSIREKMGMSMMFITHDLGVVAEISDRIVVMYAGRAVEGADTEEIFYAAQHPYTMGLLASIPGSQAPDMAADEPLAAIRGGMPDIGNMPPGCSFAPRCDFVRPICTADVPAFAETKPGHLCRCVRWNELPP
jgi:oligopeptide/dipeptide ABC transporter ATP-binding protein